MKREKREKETEIERNRGWRVGHWWLVGSHGVKIPERERESKRVVREERERERVERRKRERARG